ncbi:MAG: hypothetical protein L3K08_07835 [Thermoplasmata archaeon]|nr:hypothetical protein [Thermoplasmata archaeon]
MIELPRWMLVGISFVGIGLALWAGGNVDTAVPAAVLAVAGAAGLAAQELWPRLRRPSAPVPLPVGDPLVGLRDAFRSGRLGRQTIIASVASLHRGLGEGIRGPLSLEEERRLIRASAGEFRRWLEGEVTQLESAT